jgi:hypothetical protein
MKTDEKGYTKTPNISLAIIACLPGSAGRVYAAMLRFSYGWRKDTFVLGIATLCKLTGLSKNAVKAGIKILIDIKAISRLNSEELKNALWGISDPSKIDLSKIDPSIIDAFRTGKRSKIDPSKHLHGSKIDPHTPHLKKLKPKEIKTTTLKKAKSTAGGGDSALLSMDGIQNLQPFEREIAEILRASGLGKDKIFDLIPKVIEKYTAANAKRHVLAALASAYADKNANKKAIVAAYRLENDQVPPEYMSSDTWHFIPAEILKAANEDPERLPKKSTTRRSTISRVLGLDVING